MRAGSAARPAAGSLAGLAFVPFRACIEFHRIEGDRLAGPAAAALRYRPGASAPWHIPRGFEDVVMPDGSQEDERGVYPADRLAINPPGFCHSLRSESGCVALLIWEQPVRRIADRGGPLAHQAASDYTLADAPIHRVEGCRSGRTGRSRKPLYARAYRGFESHSLRHLVSALAGSLDNSLKTPEFLGFSARVGWRRPRLHLAVPPESPRRSLFADFAVRFPC
jgi:ChrR Cupin-like domain